MKDGRAEGEKVAKAIADLSAMMAQYSDTTLNGESLEVSISERIEKCKELNELLDSAHDASQGRNNDS